MYGWRAELGVVPIQMHIWVRGMGQTRKRKHDPLNGTSLCDLRNEGILSNSLYPQRRVGVCGYADILLGGDTVIWDAVGCQMADGSGLPHSPLMPVGMPP